MAKITTVVQKEDLIQSPLNDANKVKASDINKIVQTINVNDDLLSEKTEKGGYTGTTQDLKDELNTAVFTGATTYQTEAELLAVSPIPANGTPAKVANDPTSSKNGNYSVVNGAWVQDSSIIDNITVSEDIKTDADKLLFSDRSKQVIPESTDIGSLGYKFIRSDFDFTSIPSGYDNATWEIKDYFDLGGATINLPTNVTLFFNGGKFSNGTIVGDNTKLKDNYNTFFTDSLLFLGSWDCEFVRPEWFGSKFDAVNKSTVSGVTVWTNSDGLTSTDNTNSLQRTFDFAVINTKKILKVVMPSGRGVTGVVYVNAGQEIEGKGALENSSYAGTTLVQKPQSNEDIFRFRGKDDVNDVGSRVFWFGKITGLGFFGDKNNSSGRGMHFISDSPIPNTNPVEYFKVALQDTSILNNFLFREFPEEGVYFTDGALPLFFSDAKFLWNNSYGIRFESETSYGFQSVNFNNVSGDGNNGGLIYLNGLDNGGSINITNLKSEYRVNSAYGNVAMQDVPIVINNCLFTPISINGASHISSIPDDSDPTLKKKPSNLITVTSGLPSINWMGVTIRVRPTDTGSDPFIIGGLPIPYRYHTGNYRNGIYTTFANDTITNSPYKTTLSTWDNSPIRLDNFFFWVDSNNKFRFKNGSPTSSIDGKEIASDLTSYTDGSLNAVVGVVNVNGKHTGKVVWNSTQNRPVYAVGSSASDVWVFSDGSTSNTPV